MPKKVGILVSMIVISLLLLQNNAYIESPQILDKDVNPQNNEFLHADAGWLDDWWYRKSHVITGGMDAGENYQMSFTVYYGFGADDYNEVHCKGHCRTDFGDLRFTSSDGVTEYDYWMQNCTPGVQALFWVEIAERLNVSRTIYIYYGKSNATTTSNGTATFKFFEDFERPDSATVGNGWSEDENQTEVSISNGALNISGLQHRYAHVERPLSEGVNLVLEGNIYAPTNTRGRLASAISLYWDDHVWIRSGWWSSDSLALPEPLFFTQMNEGSGASTGGHGIPWELGNKWYRFRIMLGYTTMGFHSLDDGYTWDMMPYPIVRPENYTGAPTRIILGRGYSGNPTEYCPNPDLDNFDPFYTFPGETSYIDDVFVRSYSVYIPQHDAYGSEEINPIVDQILPVLSHPADVTFEVGETGYELTWTITDDNPLNYTVWKQDELYDFGDWDSSPMNVTVSLDGLDVGEYIFSMVALDHYINLNFDQVIVTVTAIPTSPTSSTTPTPTDGPLGEPPDLLAIGIAAGSLAIILIVVVLIIKRGKPG